MFQPWINIIAGLWALFSSFSIPLVHPTNFIITGIVMAVFGFWRPKKSWQGIINGILGLWLILSGFIPALITQANLLIVGIAVTVFAIWRLSESRTTPKRATRAAQ
ncbi:hypothetical protein QA601_07310 [Chitinispirillales bacterium ANBcel5]|uniref:SPW repeat domain-containing protein n=1 Tax=Cellulosispirillum alkaliphilum TaxID=3039283 RepID=UPI002A534031|nr:hypothetical protein [Chitinispirillales bacterium ANBcel5]